MIRLATPADASAIVQLVNSAYRGDTSRAGWTTEADLLGGQRTDYEAILEFLNAPQDAPRVIPLWIDAADAGLLACLQLQREGAQAYLGQFAVRPVQQGAGLGRQLLAAAEDYARTQWQSRAMRMTVLAQRPELQAWYQRRGYAPTGETEAFPYGDIRFGEPRRPDLVLNVLRKAL